MTALFFYVKLNSAAHLSGSDSWGGFDLLIP
jgi:hypothetical protein